MKRWVVLAILAVVTVLAGLLLWRERPEFIGRIEAIDPNSPPHETRFLVRANGARFIPDGYGASIRGDHWVVIPANTQVRDLTGVTREIQVGQTVSVWRPVHNVASASPTVREVHTEHVTVEGVDWGLLLFLAATVLGILTGAGLWYFRLRRNRPPDVPKPQSITPVDPS